MLCSGSEHHGRSVRSEFQVSRTGRVSRPEPERAVRRTGKARGTSTARAAGDTVVPAGGWPAVPDGQLQSELADVLEVLRALAAAHSMSWADVVAEAARKRDERGGFDPRIFLEYVDQVG